MQQLVVLHFQPIAEQDWLLDTFSLEQGRQKLMLKRPEYEPDLFIAYQGDWFKKTDWPTIKAWQLSNAWRLEGTELYCGLYLNELLVSLLPFSESLPTLFETYKNTLQALAEKQWPEPWLRMFEWQLLQELGYGFSWQLDNQGQRIESAQYYQFVPSTGFMKAEAGYRGDDILAFAQGSKDIRVWQLAKSIFRLALDDLLTHPLCSRTLFITGVGAQSDNRQTTHLLNT